MKQQFLKEFVKKLGPSANYALPGAGINALLGFMSGGPLGALAYGGGDLLLNTPAIAAARVARPGVTGDIVNKAGKVIKKDYYSPSNTENLVNIGASFASYPLVDLATGGRFYKDRTANKNQYYYPGIDAPPEVLRRLQQENA
tara:strand:+ start:168 stop:596 length:429 start_codon:yes stop_codon:yes gene_type:complete